MALTRNEFMARYDNGYVGPYYKTAGFELDDEMEHDGVIEMSEIRYTNVVQGSYYSKIGLGPFTDDLLSMNTDDIRYVSKNALSTDILIAVMKEADPRFSDFQKKFDNGRNSSWGPLHFFHWLIDRMDDEFTPEEISPVTLQAFKDELTQMRKGMEVLVEPLLKGF